MFDGDSLFMAAVGGGQEESFHDEPSSVPGIKNYEDFMPRRTMSSSSLQADDDHHSQQSFSETKLGKLLTTRRGLTALKKSKLEKVAKRISSRRLMNPKRRAEDVYSSSSSESTTLREESEHSTTHHRHCHDSSVVSDPEKALFEGDDALYMQAVLQKDEPSSSSSSSSNNNSNNNDRGNYFSVAKQQLLARVTSSSASEQQQQRPRSIISKIRDPQKNPGVVSWPYYDNIMAGDDVDDHGMRHNNNNNNTPNNFKDKVTSEEARSRRWWMMALVVATICLTLTITLPMVLASRKGESNDGILPPIYSDLAQIGDLDHLFENPRLYHDWSEAHTKHPEQLFFLHPVNATTHGEIAVKTPRGGNVTIFLLTTQRKDSLVNSILQDLHGHKHAWCSETWPAATPKHVPEGTVVILPTTMQDTQIAACVDGRLVAYAMHLYVPSWNGLEQVRVVVSTWKYT